MSQFKPSAIAQVFCRVASTLFLNIPRMVIIVNRNVLKLIFRVPLFKDVLRDGSLGELELPSRCPNHIVPAHHASTVSR